MQRLSKSDLDQCAGGTNNMKTIKILAKTFKHRRVMEAEMCGVVFYEYIQGSVLFTIPIAKRVGPVYTETLSAMAGAFPLHSN